MQKGVGAMHRFDYSFLDNGVLSAGLMKRGERDEKGMTVAQLKEWAKSLGWHKESRTDFILT